MEKRRQRTWLGFSVAAVLPMLGLSGCIVAAPEDMQLPSPDGQFVLLVDFGNGGLTLRPGIEATLTLRHRDMENAPFKTLSPVRRLEMAWTQPRVIRICAPDAADLQDQTLSVPTQAGAASFQVQYACPAQAGPIVK